LSSGGHGEISYKAIPSNQKRLIIMLRNASLLTFTSLTLLAVTLHAQVADQRPPQNQPASVSVDASKTDPAKVTPASPAESSSLLFDGSHEFSNSGSHGGFLRRLCNAYGDEFRPKNGTPEDSPEAPRRALPAPFDSPPMASGE
jgi:hypothetical protein